MNFAIVKIIQSTYRHCDSYKFHSQFKSIVLNTNLINGKTEKEVQNVFQSLTRVTKCSKISRSLYNEGDFCQFFFIYSFLWPALKCDALFYIFLFHQFKSLPDSFKVLSISSATWFLLLFHVAAAYWQVKLVVQFSSSSYTATTMMMMEVIFLLSRCFFWSMLPITVVFVLIVSYRKRASIFIIIIIWELEELYFHFWELTNEAEKRTMSNAYEY